MLFIQHKVTLDKFDLDYLLKKKLPRKKSVNTHIYLTLLEKTFVSSQVLREFSNIVILCKLYKFLLNGYVDYNLKKRLVVNLVFRDMIHSYKTWRHIRGYPVNGQRTWSNGKSVSKNNSLLKNFRINQILIAYGKKRKNKATQLVQAEYINKLWFKTWRSEWKQARKFNLRSARGRRKKRTIVIDLKSLSSGVTGGYVRKGKARRFNKAKKKFKNITIGLPIFFTRHLFSKVFNKRFLVDFSLMHEQRKMKSKKKAVKKKIIKKKTKKK